MDAAMQGYGRENWARVELRTRRVRGATHLREQGRVIRDGSQARAESVKGSSIAGDQRMPICPMNPMEAPLYRKRLKMKIAPYNRLITKGRKKCSQ